MDYGCIYNEFIKDRRAKEAALTGYSERHHILPRCLGGSDEKENLINLTAEDHYFAHLLLARIHGARLASALYLLVLSVESNWNRRYSTRRNYGFGKRLAARLKAAHWAGSENPLFNAEVYRWINYRTGATENATLFEMHRKYGCGRATWSGVLSGHSPSVKGWMPADRATTHKASQKGQVFHFVNRDGREFTGTQSEFAAANNINFASTSRVVRERSVTRCGWRRKGVTDRPANYAKDGLPARQRREVNGIATG